jgi:hypothetical protein
VYLDAHNQVDVELQNLLSTLGLHIIWPNGGRNVTVFQPLFG